MDALPAMDHDYYEQVFICPTCKTFSSEPKCKCKHNAYASNDRQTTINKLLANFVSVGYKIVPNTASLKPSGSLRSYRTVKQSFICHVCGVESFEAKCTKNHDEFTIPKDSCDLCSAEFDSVSELLQHKAGTHPVAVVEIKEEPPEDPFEDVMPAESEILTPPTEMVSQLPNKFTQLVLKGTLGIGQYQVMTSNAGFVYPEVEDKEEEILEWDDSIELAVLTGGEGSVTSLTKSEEVVVPVEQPKKQEPIPKSTKQSRQFLRCIKCEKEFHTVDHLIYHICLQRARFPGYQCPFCQRWYIKEQWFGRHLKLHNSLLPLPCNRCDAGFLTPEELKGHRCVKKATPKPPQPPKLRRVIDVVESEDTGAISSSNSNKPGRPALPHYYICQICNISLRSERQLNLHLHIHELAKANAIDAAMQQGVATGNEERQLPSSLPAAQPEATSESPPPKEPIHIFECNICSLTMRSIEEVRVHLASHASNRLYKCESCNERFATTRNLQQHKCAKLASAKPPVAKQPAKRKAKDPPKQVVLPKLIVTNAEEKVEEEALEHKCGICGKNFGQAAGLACHMKDHGGYSDGRFQCEKCPMKFKILRNLIVHRAKLH